LKKHNPRLVAGGIVHIGEEVAMTAQARPPSRWTRVPVSLRAIVIGVAIALTAANVWPALLLSLGVPLASIAEAVFLAVSRSASFRGALQPAQWLWGLLAALAFAATVHAAIVLLFRLVPFPIAAFREGYDLSFIPSLRLQWLAIVVSATSAGICEETGFRGYLQQPIEERHGAPAAIFVSSLLFMLVHLTKGWALIGMVPIVFGAGVLLGCLAWSSRSLIPGMIGHTLMDIGLFGYWWTGVAGNFTARPISETGMDRRFFITCAALATAIIVVTLTIWRFRRMAKTLGCGAEERI
jgi:membrane protease YdiL (CAAX protease family)